MIYNVIPGFLEGTPEQEKDWQYRRRRRLQRYGKVFQGRVTPGLKKGASRSAQKKAGRSIAKIKKSAEKWSARGAKKGAGGRIRSEPDYMNRLIKSYKKKKMNRSSKGRYWKEWVEAVLEAYKRPQRLLKVAKAGKKAAKEYRTAKTAGQAKGAKLTALRAAGVLGRKVGGQSRSKKSRKGFAKVYKTWKQKYGF